MLLSQEFLRHFVSLDVRRCGQELCLENHQVIAPVPFKSKEDKEKQTGTKIRNAVSKKKSF